MRPSVLPWLLDFLVGCAIIAGAIWLLSLQLHAATPDCTGTPSYFFVETIPPLTKVYGPVVPASEVWLITAAGIFERDPTVQPNSEWMLELIEPLPAETGYPDASGDDAQIQKCCYRVPLQKQTVALATPVLALTRSFLLMPGRRLAGRTNNAISFGIDGVYWKYPAACAAGLVR
jgi:hypothetical protein